MNMIAMPATMEQISQIYDDADYVHDDNESCWEHYDHCYYKGPNANAQ